MNRACAIRPDFNGLQECTRQIVSSECLSSHGIGSLQGVQVEYRCPRSMDIGLADCIVSLCTIFISLLTYLRHFYTGLEVIDYVYRNYLIINTHKISVRMVLHLYKGVQVEYRCPRCMDIGLANCIVSLCTIFISLLTYLRYFYTGMEAIDYVYRNYLIIDTHKMEISS
jgi:hypothetical protein